MKKILCTLLVLIASVVSANATDGITAQNVTVPKGGTALLEIDLTSETQLYGGFQFELELPDNILATEVLTTKRITDVEAAAKKSFSADINRIDPDKSVYQVLVSNSSRMEIAGESGAVLYIKLKANDLVTVGAILDGKITKVFLSNIDAIQTNGVNSTFNITIDSRFTLDENSTIAPEASTGNVDVCVFRSIKANEWSTICLPFSMTEAQVKAAFGQDVQLGEFNNYEVVEEGRDVVGVKIKFTTATSINANHPYAIRVSSPIDYDKGFTVSGVQISPIEEELYYNLGTNRRPSAFVGTYIAETTVPNLCLFLSGNKFWYSAGKTKMKAFRAYFDLYDVLTEVDDAYGSRISMSFEDPTGINEVSVQEDDRYYNLSGQQVKPEKKGLYIQNGKKKIIK